MTTITERYTMLYDGRCRFCVNQAEQIARWDSTGRIATRDLNDPEVAALFPQVSPTAAREALHVVSPDGHVFRGAEAVRALLAQVPALKPLAALLHVPGAMTIANPLYAWVARNRYTLFGTTRPSCDDGTCELR